MSLATATPSWRTHPPPVAEPPRKRLCKGAPPHPPTPPSSPGSSDDEGEEHDDYEESGEESGKEGEEESGEEESGEEGSSEDEASFSDSGGGSDGEGEEDEEPVPNDIDHETLRKMYEEGRLRNEPPGLADQPQFHAAEPDPDELWRQIRAKLGTNAARRQWGVVASEVWVQGELQRVVHRVDYGWKFESWCRKKLCGTYDGALLPTVQHLFDQQPYVDPPEFDENGNMELKKSYFQDFKPAYYTDNAEDAGLFENNDASDHGPVWCICTQCTNKGLKNVTVMRHTPSGIYLVVGGKCSFYMVRMRSYYDVFEAANGMAPNVVGAFLGVGQ